MNKFSQKIQSFHSKRHPKILAISKPIGLAITTYGFSPYIHLHLEQAKRIYPHIPIVICDDHSNDNRLYECANRYDCKILSTERRYGWLPGDMMLWKLAIEWAENNNINCVVKMSRRFIPLINFSKNLINIIDDSDTYGRLENNYQLTTFCIGLSTNYWYNKIKDINNIAKNYSINIYGCPERCMLLLNRRLKLWKEIYEPQNHVHYLNCFILSKQFNFNYQINDFHNIWF